MQSRGSSAALNCSRSISCRQFLISASRRRSRVTSRPLHIKRVSLAALEEYFTQRHKEDAKPPGSKYGFLCAFASSLRLCVKLFATLGGKTGFDHRECRQCAQGFVTEGRSLREQGRTCSPASRRPR